MSNQVPNTRINSLAQVESALRVLTAQGYDTQALWAEHNAWLEAMERRPVTEFDRQWATRLARMSLGEHYSRVKDRDGWDVGNEAAVLAASLCHAGRQFRLSPGQRAVLREWYGLTPTRLVELVGVETFADCDVISAFTIRNAQHIDARERRHALVEVRVHPAAEFFAAGKHQDDVYAATTEADRFLARVERLIDRARREKVEHGLSAPGGVAHQLHAEVLARHVALDDHSAIRELLRSILVSRGESALAELVKEPRFFPAEEKVKQSAQPVAPKRTVRNMALDYLKS